MNVLVIAEDFVKDEHVLKPILGAMMNWLERPTAKVRVCRAPRLRGVAQALDWERIKEILDRYRMTDLFILCVDRDGNQTRVESLRRLEAQAKQVLTSEQIFLAENAWQELEVWVLAGHSLPRGWSWKAIRQENNPKETYFIPFAQRRGVLSGLAEGRKALAEDAAREYHRIRQRCPEDVKNLEERIAEWLTRQR